MADRAPSYVSSRSADIILSEIRPTKIKPETLLSINVLLDELLWLVLGSARSLTPPRLKSSFNKILATNLGKAAILEAEVELRAYKDRANGAALSDDEFKPDEFPLQAIFELLREKCEVLCSLGDREENPALESRLQDRVLQASSSPPKLSSLIPAALYLTAVLEHVSEHILSNVARVVARDSSRTTTHVNDLYTALCEDESIYNLFRTMKVHEQILAQTRPTHQIRPSKSFNRFRPDGTPQTTPVSLVQGQIGRRTSVNDGQKSRPSNESNGSRKNGRASDSAEPKLSIDTAKAPSAFSRSGSAMLRKGSPHSSSPSASEEHDHAQRGAPHTRSESILSESTKRTFVAFQDSDKGTTTAHSVDTSYSDDTTDVQDFDELMRSGTTMKVSLTPDRLRTFEVFAKEKNKRANRSGLGTASPQTDSSATSPKVNSPATPLSPPKPMNGSARGPALMARGPHKAADQDEDDEEEEFDPRHGKPRQRKQSLVEFLAEPPPWEAVHDMLAPPKKPKVADSATIRPPRVRAKTEAPPPPSFKHHDLLRKPSFTFGKAPPNKGQPPTPPPQSTAFPTVPQIKRPAKSRESFDYDDSFDDDSVGGHHGVSAPKAAPKSQPGKPHLAPSTRELVAFLDEGPPDVGPPARPHPASHYAGLPDPALKPKSSRGFKSMVTRLTRGASTERIGVKDDFGEKSFQRPDTASSLNSTTRRSAASSVVVTLPSKRSFTNVRSNVSTVPWAVPASPDSSNDHTSPPAPPAHAFTRKNSIRKAVPVFRPEDLVGPQAFNNSDTAPPTRSATPAASVDGTSTPPPEREVEVIKPIPRVLPKVEPLRSRVPRVKEEVEVPAEEPIVVSESQESSSSDTERKAAALAPTRPEYAPTLVSQVGAIRNAIAKATSVEESRILLDMFLARCGLFPSEEAEESSAEATDVDMDQEDYSVIEILLGDSPIDISDKASVDDSEPVSPRTPADTQTFSPPSKADGSFVHHKVVPVIVQA